ncbi:MAG: ABC transporter ATP-binding protein [Defluviitaleaceae bacterium]|nr:ABC transporter ATP-binding protein [Defluviitaleaceae bacterium]
MSEIIRTECVVKTFGSKHGNIVTAVGGISITVERGSFTVLRGKSGSGKTTLINLIGALDKPDKGKIWVCGEEITEMPQAQCEKLRRTRIGFIFQSVALFGDMTALENVEFAMRVAGISYKERLERAKECLDMVGMTGRIKHIPQELSGGEQQRVAIARAIAHKPALILADEPTAQLDTKMGLQIIKLLLMLTKDEGITVVMSSHDPEIADVAHKLYTLKDGELSDEL